MVESQNQQGVRTKNRLDGDDLRAMLAAALDLFELNVKALNALNVFPVPDGDTGTNMFLTLREVSKYGESVTSKSAGDVASAMARGALMEARGNSGVILSQFFRGIALEFEGQSTFGPQEFARSLDRARLYAYKAVANPVEGTMLTVIRFMAEAAGVSADAGNEMPQLLDDIYDAARDAVARTPSMLSILREAGVVDAGGQGLLVILEGLRQYLGASEPKLYELEPPEPVGLDDLDGNLSMDFLDATDEEIYGYCTQLWIKGENLDPDSVRESLQDIASSTVVVGDETMVNLHVHVDDPGPVISLGVSLGTLTQVKIESMDDQRREYAAQRRTEATGTDLFDRRSETVEVVAVASGRGLEMVFSELGAAALIAGGDSMNPSTADILDAVAGVSADQVILLPNNRNVISTARQAAAMSDKSLTIVSSTSIPEGIAAMLEFNPDNGLDANVSEMERKSSNVRTAEVCTAVRPAFIGGVEVEEGQIIGLLDRRVVVSGLSPADVLESLLEKAAVSEGDLVTLYRGEPLPQAEAQSALERVEATFPDSEFELVEGDQPYYHFIVSIE